MRGDSHLDSHGLCEPLYDGQKGIGGQHGRLVTLGVDNLAHHVRRDGKLTVLNAT